MRGWRMWQCVECLSTPLTRTLPLTSSKIYSRSLCIVPIPLQYIYLYIQTNMHLTKIDRYFNIICSLLIYAVYRMLHMATAMSSAPVTGGPGPTHRWRPPRLTAFRGLATKPQSVTGPPLPFLKKAGVHINTFIVGVPTALRPFAVLSCAVCRLLPWQAHACRLKLSVNQFKKG